MGSRSRNEALNRAPRAQAGSLVGDLQHTHGGMRIVPFQSVIFGALCGYNAGALKREPSYGSFQEQV